MPKIHTCRYNISQLNFYISLWKKLKKLTQKHHHEIILTSCVGDVMIVLFETLLSSCF